MQLLTDVRQKAVEFAEANTQLLLTAGGVVGTAATGVLAWRGGYKTGQNVLFQENAVLERENEPVEFLNNPMSTTDKIKLGAVDALPPLLIGTATIISIIMGHKVSAQKAAALAAAYGLSQKQFEEYKEKVAEKLTGPKAQQIDDELAQDRVSRTPGHENIVVIEGEVLCFDEPSGRYFHSTMEKIKQAVNATNAEILHHDHANLGFFYDELELPGTAWSDEVGWNTDNLLELKYSTVLSPDKKPCIAINFQTSPRMDYIPKSY